MLASLERPRRPDRGPRRARVLLAVLAAVALVAAPHAARANGRFPLARYLVVGPGEDSRVFAIQTTFGLVVSTDGGRTWRWICEQAVGFSGKFDPSLVIAHNGDLVSGLPDGLAVARQDFCTFTRPPTAPSTYAIDLAGDPLGDRLVAAMSPITGDSTIATSDDHGATWQAGWTHNSYLITVEIAPGRPSRMYASGWAQNAGVPAVVPAFFRSDDGGRTFVETSRAFTSEPWIVGIDATNPDTVYARMNLDRGTALLRSDDGGATFRQLIATADRMLGATLAPDGRRLWVGSASPSEGILRSTDGGAHWARVGGGFTTYCLRYHAGVLYVCGDELREGFSIACSTDEGATFGALMAFGDIRPPETCAAGTPARDECIPRWPLVESSFMVDGGVPRLRHGCCHGSPDAGCDGGAATTDAGAAMDAGGRDMDAGRTDAPAAGSEPVTPRGCGRCGVAGVSRVPAGGRRGAAGAGAVLGLAALAAGGSRRRRSRELLHRA